jgi:hypothetical protein
MRPKDIRAHFPSGVANYGPGFATLRRAVDQARGLHRSVVAVGDGSVQTTDGWTGVAADAAGICDG